MKHLAASTTRSLRSSQARIAVLFFLALLVPLWSSSNLIPFEIRNNPGRTLREKVLNGARLLRKPGPQYVTEDLELFPHPRVQDHILHPHQHPVSHWRPHHQFSSSPVALSQQYAPVFVLGSVALDPLRDIIDLTYQSLAQSSLKLWRWVIVDDGSTNPESLAILEKLVRLDSRITLYRMPTHKRRATAETLRQLMLESGASYGAFINPSSMLEHTILEKSAWAFASVPTWNLVGHFEGGDTLHAGVHADSANLVVSGSDANTGESMTSLESDFPYL